MNKRGFEMTINTVVVLVIALILLSVGIFIIYNKILKPSETATSVLECESRNGNPVTSCSGCESGVCLRLPTGDDNRPFCCIEKLV